MKGSDIGENILPAQFETRKGFPLYQFVLFLLTQAGYFAVTGSMLHTTFLEPSKEICNQLVQYSSGNDFGRSNESRWMDHFKSFGQFREHLLKNEFHSIAVEWNEECGRGSGAHGITIIAPGVLMSGAIFGSFSAGFLADRFGRKPTVISCLLIVCLANIFISLIGASRAYSNDASPSNVFRNPNWQLPPYLRFTVVLVALFITGAACGGYMVTNMVFLVEALHNSARLRLLVISLNGWPLGMIFTAIVGALSVNWRIYHLIIALSAILIVALLEIFSLESFDWHLHRGNQHLAIEVHNNMQKRYAKAGSTNEFLVAKQVNEDSDTENMLDGSDLIMQQKPVAYSYLDLFRHTTIYVPLAKLSYCFFSSSVVSYGLFFSVDALPGNRYVNLGIMGAGKFILGIGSFLIAFRIGRRIIMVISLGISCVLCWTLLALFAKQKYLEPNHFNSTSVSWEENNGNHGHVLIVTWIALMLTAALDPTWKMNHLLSTEIFPVQVRNMSRGLCNVAARIGSMAGPLMIYLRMVSVCLPYWVYSILLTVHFIIAFTFPETKDRTLPNEMPVAKTRTNTMTMQQINDS